MSGLLDRLGNAFLAPPAVELPASARAEGRGEARHRVAPRAVAPSIAILCRPEDALPLGGAAALLLAARGRAPRGLVAVWGAGVPVRAPARAGARRLAASLETRGHDTVATGRLAVVRLQGTLREASTEAVRARAAAADAASAVVIAGARTEAADALLRDQDEVLVALRAGSDAMVAELTLAGLADGGVRARRLDVPHTPPPARALAACGVAVVPPLRAAIEAALEGLR